MPIVNNRINPPAGQPWKVEINRQLARFKYNLYDVMVIKVTCFTTVTKQTPAYFIILFVILIQFFVINGQIILIPIMLNQRKEKNDYGDSENLERTEKSERGTVARKYLNRISNHFWPKNEQVCVQCACVCMRIRERRSD